jgi:hypothetical protein
MREDKTLTRLLRLELTGELLPTGLIFVVERWAAEAPTRESSLTLPASARRAADSDHNLDL